jgi:hypothetical protein
VRRTQIFFFLTSINRAISDLAEGYLSLDIDALIDYVGTEGRYQYFLVYIASLMSMVMSMILYSSNFIIVDPDFYCNRLTGPTCPELGCKRMG